MEIKFDQWTNDQWSVNVHIIIIVKDATLTEFPQCSFGTQFQESLSGYLIMLWLSEYVWEFLRKCFVGNSWTCLNLSTPSQQVVRLRTIKVLYPTGWKYTLNLIQRPGSDRPNSQN